MKKSTWQCLLLYIVLRTLLAPIIYGSYYSIPFIFVVALMYAPALFLLFYFHDVSIAKWKVKPFISGLIVFILAQVIAFYTMEDFNRLFELRGYQSMWSEKSILKTIIRTQASEGFNYFIFMGVLLLYFFLSYKRENLKQHIN